MRTEKMKYCLKIGENLPKLIEDMNPQIQESQWITNRIIKRQFTHTHIMWNCRMTHFLSNKEKKDYLQRNDKLIKIEARRQ